MKGIGLALTFLMIACMAGAASPETGSRYIKRDPSKREVVVFVHGVTGDSTETWTNASTNAYWPALIREDPAFADANVWVFSYFSPQIVNAQDIEELATKLGDEMRAQDVFAAHDRVYFVAHSMGGLITREMLAQQLPPANKVPLIYFFGTPSAGADNAGVVAAISKNPQFANMRPFTRESDVEKFSKRWLSTAENAHAHYPQKILSFCAYEIQPYVGNMVIVTEASASYLCSTVPRGALANHVTMVKPADTKAESYQYFLSAYKFAKSPEGQFIAAVDAITVHSASVPGLRVGSLRLRRASFGSDPIQVHCNQVATGEKRLKLDLSQSERLIAVKPEFKLASGVQAKSASSSFDPGQGSVTVGYRVQGLPENPTSGCKFDGRAEMDLEYLVEER